MTDVYGQSLSLEGGVMVDDRMSLTFSVRNNPGRYALLLGSGISTEAGVPTGWQIVTDLCEQVATAAGDDIPDGTTPPEWYEEQYGESPTYEGLIGRLGQTPAERRTLLEGYFEPSETEANRDEKTPTDAHRSIAWLVDKGYINVILTTNFDQLLEDALREQGVTPVIISGEETAAGAEPLAHLDAVVIKANGDYKETNIKNLGDELETYSDPMQQCIDRVFQEHGLIVCGWSGKHDTRLRKSLRSCERHRYTTFWSYYSDVGDVGEKIVAHRDGVTIQNEGAARFFTELKDSVQALEGATSGEPLSTEIARERTKRYLTRPEHQIELADLIADTAAEAAASIHDQDRFPLEVDPETFDLDDRLREYGNLSRKVLIEAIVCGYWGDETVNSGRESVVKTVAELAPTNRPDRAYNEYLEEVRRYPATLVLYGAGLTAMAAGNWALVHDLLTTPVEVYRATASGTYEKDPVKVLHPRMLVSEAGGRLEKEGADESLRQSLQAELEEPAMEFFVSKSKYEEAFKMFEILFDLRLYEETDDDFMHSIGTTYWGETLDTLKGDIRDNSGGQPPVREGATEASNRAQPEEWPPVRDGILKSNEPKVVNMLDDLKEFSR